MKLYFYLQILLSLLTHTILATLPCHEPAVVPHQTQRLLLVPVYHQAQQQQATVAEAEGYADGYGKAPPPPPPPPCQPCQQYHVLAPAPLPQPKPIFRPSAAFYGRAGIGLGAYFSAYKVQEVVLQSIYFSCSSLQKRSNNI